MFVELNKIKITVNVLKHKGKSVSLQTWSSPEGSRKLRFPDFVDNGSGWW